MYSVLSDRSIYGRHHTNYSIAFDMVDGSHVWFNNSPIAVTSKEMEKTSFKCAAISYTATERRYLIQQFSIYIRVNSLRALWYI